MSILSLQDAKDQLVITDDDHDRQVQAALDNAEGIIAAYMKTRWDPTWTVLPGPVNQAVKFMLTHVYENKGDNLADRDERVWTAVRHVLDQSRDPAYA
jgi:Phage gp6-like head-tail connector protein